MPDFSVDGAADIPGGDDGEEVVALDDAEVDAYIKALQVGIACCMSKSRERVLGA